MFLIFGSFYFSFISLPFILSMLVYLIVCVDFFYSFVYCIVCRRHFLQFRVGIQWFHFVCCFIIKLSTVAPIYFVFDFSIEAENTLRKKKANNWLIEAFLIDLDYALIAQFLYVWHAYNLHRLWIKTHAPTRF